MDDDRDGLISAENVDVAKIDTDVLELISEVIFALEDERVLNFESFCDMVKGLNVLPKLREMYGFKVPEDNFRSSEEVENCTYKLRFF